MNAGTLRSTRSNARPRRTLLLAATAAALLFLALAPAALAQPTLSKVFTPSEVGPGGVSTITLTITNGSGVPVTGVGFTDVLPVAPAAMTIADPANASTTCDLVTGGGTLDAPDGGSAITLTDASLGGFQSCTVTVDVAAPTTAGVYTNPAITLNSSAGSSMSLAVDLTVALNRPGFSKSFAPASIDLGERSTLTFTIDNTANAAAAFLIAFTDNLPAGMTVADPANASHDCNASSTGILTAVPGSGVISYSSGSVALGSTCTVTLDVVGTGTGMLDNVTGELTSTPGASTLSSGKASATLAVSSTPLTIQKSFTDDPVPPNGFVDLDFTITNFDRNFSATGVAFSDDLTSLVPPLAGLSVDSLLANDCGDVTASGTLIDLSNGVIAPEGTCTVSVRLAVTGAIAGAYVNTSSAVSGMVDGSPVAGNAATDTLFVDPIPTFTKEFIDDPVTGGGTVTLRFTITNTDPTSPLTAIAFTDDIGGTDSTPGRLGALPGLAANGLVDGTGLNPAPLVDPCGAGSQLTIPDPNDTNPSPPFPNLPSDPTQLVFTGGSLAEAGMPGDTCTFDVVLDVPEGAASSVYLNTTSELTATPQGAPAASDGLIVVAAPKLTKEFTDDPVVPGGTVTLSFTLSHPAEAIATASAVGFTDDLNAMGIAGLVVNLPPSPDPPCGAGSSLTAPGNVLTLQNGELLPGQDCTFSVTLDVPALAVADTYTNTTSLVDAMVAGLAVTSSAASDTLVVAGVTLTKEFVDDPTIAGDLVTLRFTIENIHPTENATALAFDDNLAAVLPGASDLVVEPPLPVAPCGALSTITGTTSLSFDNGELAANDMCSFDVVLRVPVGIADGSYGNVTTSLTGVQAGGGFSFDPVADALTVDSTRIELTKTFTDDPVAPGDFVAMELTLTNLDPDREASAIAFTDDLDAALTGLTFDSVTNDGCSATITGETTTTIDVAGITLGAAASCTIVLSLEVPGGAAAGSYENVTSEVTGAISGLDVRGEPASDFLDIIQILGFSKSFDGPTTATGSAILTFTIDNPGTGTSTGIYFSDNLDDVLPGLIATGLPALPCGAGSSITGVGLLTFNGGEVAAMDSCVFEVEVLVPADATVGTYPNTTTPLYQSGLAVSSVATADLVIEPPPTFMKTFSPDFVGAGQLSTLTFTINNTASAVDATDLDFTDNLPGDLVVAPTPSTSTTCTGGTLTADAGTGIITYTGGTVAAGASCTVTVDVAPGSTGFYNNTTGDLTSSSGNSGKASDTLAVDPPPSFSKSFSPNKIAVDGITTLTFTIDNNLAVSDATDLDFTDNLPAAIVIATPSNAVTDCTGGTLTADDGTAVITYTGGTVTAGASCTIQVDVTSAVVGTHQNSAGHLTSSLGDSGGANANLRVNPPPVFTKAFAPDPTVVGVDGVVTLTFTIDNTAANVTATDLAFTDPLPAALRVATPANVTGDCNGTVTAVEGSGTISLTGGSINGQCSFSVDVVAVASGDIVNTTGDLTSSLNNSGPAVATLRVNPPPVFAKAFAPATILVGDTATLTLSINNTASTADAIVLDFTDTMPAEILVADPPNATTDCGGGIVTADAGTSVVAYTGGIVTAATNCTVSVDVTSSVLGAHLNTTSDLTSSLGASAPANATLTVVDLDPPVVTSVTTSAGALNDCDTVRTLISDIFVTITDDRTPVVGADSPAGYLLVGSGPDGDFSTVDCSGAAGDDTTATIFGVSVDATDPLQVVASVTVAGAEGLVGGMYRFFVCDTITDTASNALDGDGDTTAGGLWEVPFFRADPGNRIGNGHFDDCPVTLDPWTLATVSSNAIQLGGVGADDHLGSPRSAATRVVQSDFGVSSLTQCVDVEGDVPYDFESWLRFEPVAGALALFAQTCEYFDTAGCTGLSLGESSFVSLLEGASGYIFNESIVQTAVGAVSAQCTFETEPFGADPLYDLYLDGLFFGAGDLGGLFADGFESGDTSAWSTTVP